jgi:hypothetical protein
VPFAPQFGAASCAGASPSLLTLQALLNAAAARKHMAKHLPPISARHGRNLNTEDTEDTEAEEVRIQDPKSPFFPASVLSLLTICATVVKNSSLPSLRSSRRVYQSRTEPGRASKPAREARRARISAGYGSEEKRSGRAAQPAWRRERWMDTSSVSATQNTAQCRICFRDELGFLQAVVLATAQPHARGGEAVGKTHAAR